MILFLFLFTFTIISTPDYSFNIETKEIVIGPCIGKEICQITQADYRKSGPFQTYKKITINPGATSVGSQAFLESSAVEEIYISSWIQSIVVPFCRSCPRLRFIGITSESQYFETDKYGNLYQKGKEVLVRSPSALKSFQLEDTTTIILEQAFQQSQSSTITIPARVTQLKSGLFFNSACSKIMFAGNSTIKEINSSSIAISQVKSIEFPSSLTHINADSVVENPNLHSVSFPANSKLLFLGEGSFRDNPMLASIRLPDSTTTVCGGTFSGCTSLATVHLSLNLSSLNSTAFSGCSAITTVTIPEGNEHYMVSNGSLYTKNMESLILIPPTTEVLEIAKELKSIGTTALQVCSKLSQLIIEDNHPVYLKHDTMLIDRERMEVLAFVGGITSVSFPAGVKSLGPYCAYKCLKLESVNVPPTVTSIGQYCFSQSSVTSIDLPNVTSIGESAFESCKDLVNISFIQSGKLTFGTGTFISCSSISKLHFKCSVTNVPYRFCQFCGAQSVTFEKDGFTYIDSGSFEAMSRLEYIDFPRSLKVLYSNSLQSSSVKTILFSQGCGVETIQTNVFLNCRNLENIMFDGSLKTIGSNAFQGCSSLASVNISDDCPITELSVSNLFLNCVSLEKFNVPRNVVKVEPSAFAGCTNLVSVTATGSSVFESDGGILYDIQNDEKRLVVCPPGLSKAIVSESVSGLGVRCFYGCEKLVSIVFLSSTRFTDIGESVFYGCRSLSELRIPKSVEAISSTSFTGCSNLSTVVFEDKSRLREIGNKTFSVCSSLSSINLEKCTKLEVIPRECFMSCSALASIRFPAEVETIEYSAFSGCSQLGSIVFESNETLKEIKASAFSGCKFESVDLPTSLESIGANAFAGSGLSDTLRLPSNISAVGTGALSGCPLKHVIYCGGTRLAENALGDTATIVHVTNAYPLVSCLGVPPERDLAPECYVVTANPVHADRFLMCLSQCIILGEESTISEG